MISHSDTDVMSSLSKALMTRFLARAVGYMTSVNRRHEINKHRRNGGEDHECWLLLLVKFISPDNLCSAVVVGMARSPYLYDLAALSQLTLGRSTLLESCLRL